MLLKGTILRNRYQVLRHLGTGGFADTYLAQDRDLPGYPQCVIKNLKPTSPNPEVLPIARRLFETEAQVLYLLGQHEQIPKLLAHFEENGEFYLVQEFVDGHDLGNELLPGKRLSEHEVVQLLRGILEGLVIVHQRNIIHRDIKPQNLMRRRTDGKIVLIDFGAVKEIGTLAVNSQGQVRSTITIGTPGYMPNEQANCDPKLCSDIYAVGVIGIQALTGLLPQQLLQDPTTGELIWRNYVQVSDQLANVLSKMVCYHFSQRYQSATEALQALNSLSIQSQPTSLTITLPSVTRLPRSSMQACLIGLMGLGVGVATALWTINHQSQMTSISSSVPSLASRNINFAIKPQFDNVREYFSDDVRDFSEGLARVIFDGRVGYINSKGNFVIQPQFDGASYFSNGLALAWIYGKNRGYIDKTGHFVIPPQFARNAAHNFSEGLARLCIIRTCGYIDKTGHLVIERKFPNAQDFSNGLAAVMTSHKWGYINKSGKFVIPAHFDEANHFSQELAAVKTNDKWGYINKSGKFVIPAQFDKANNFSQELAAVKTNDKWGFINQSGQIVIQPQFNEVSDFFEGLVAVKTNDKWSFINKNGNFIIEPQFDEVKDFSEGLARVKMNEKWGYINTHGHLIIQPQFDKCGKFSDGLAWVSSGNKIGYIRNPSN
jgi:serine/threonine protein kinase